MLAPDDVEDRGILQFHRNEASGFPEPNEQGFGEPLAQDGLNMSIWDWLFGKISTPRDESHGSVSSNGSARIGASALSAPGGGSATAVADEDAWWMPQPDALFEPAPIPRPDLSPDARALENILISHFDGHDLQVPPLMQVVEKALRRLGKNNCNFSEVARELSEDPVIAGSVLRIANSPLYRGTTKITSVQQGVTRLGHKAVRTLLMHESMRSAMFGSKGKDRFAEALWKRSLASAVVMRELAKVCGCDEDDAYLLGLLHDIGSVLVLRILRGEMKFGKFEIDEDEFEFLCQESHQEFGELIAAEWKLPPAVAQIVGDHHRHPEPNDENRNARLQIILTDMIVCMLGFGTPASYNLLRSTAATELGLAGRREFNELLDRLPVEIDDVLGAI